MVLWGTWKTELAEKLRELHGEHGKYMVKLRKRLWNDDLLVEMSLFYEEREEEVE